MCWKQCGQLGQSFTLFVTNIMNQHHKYQYGCVSDKTTDIFFLYIQDSTHILAEVQKSSGSGSEWPRANMNQHSGWPCVTEAPTASTVTSKLVPFKHFMLSYFKSLTCAVLSDVAAHGNTTGRIWGPGSKKREQRFHLCLNLGSYFKLFLSPIVFSYRTFVIWSQQLSFWRLAC